MKNIVIGSRSSALARVQAEIARSLLADGTGLKFSLRWLESPGDRDLATPIERAAPDFFTRDLDNAVRSGKIACAVHSAKDLPNPMPSDIDWFWLPEACDDPRDCWVTAKGVATLGRSPRIGVSSERRSAYAVKTFPKARLLPVRGAIDSRIEQLRRGDFDALLMATAGLSRLYPDGVPGVTVEPISLADLPPPPGQGVLAVTFLKGNALMQEVRRAFVKAVRFVSGGVGDPGLLTVRGREDIESADIVLYDDLIGEGMGCDGGTPGKWVYVGKRAGRHSMDQAAITRLLCDCVRRGGRVVRLKGGDAGLFGRLAEETEALESLGIPFVVRPGVSALTAATTPTGMLLTRRGEARRFEVCTPREGRGVKGNDGCSRNVVMFMAASVFVEEAKKLVREGWPKDTPFAIVRDACGPRERIERGTIGDVRRDVVPTFAKGYGVAGIAPCRGGDGILPGLVVVGPAAAHAFPKSPRVLLTCSEAVMPRARLHFEDMGRKVVEWPMIELRARRAFCEDDVAGFDYIVFTSPSSVRIFFGSYSGNLRALPRFITCGAGTDAELRRFGFASDIMPKGDFSAKGLIAEINAIRRSGEGAASPSGAICPKGAASPNGDGGGGTGGSPVLAGKRVLRLRSALAGSDVARALRRAGAQVADEVLYDNAPVERDGGLPAFDEVFFASASGAKAFLARYGRKAIKGKKVYVMGAPTESALPKGRYARVRW